MSLQQNKGDFVFLGINPAQHGTRQKLYSVAIGRGEELRVISCVEPVRDEGLLHHVSVSVGMLGVQVAHRRPTDTEFNRVKEAFFDFVQIPVEEPTDHPYVRHWWER